MALEQSEEDLDGAMSQGIILLIESDSDQAKVVEAELSRLGFGVVWSNSHLKALSILEDRKDVDLVLAMAEPTDIGGFDFIHLLRHRNRFETQCPQVIVIAAGEFFEKFPLDEAGIDDYLLRPYFPGELAWRVNKAVKALRTRQLRAPMHQTELSSGIYTAPGLKKVLHEELNKIFRKKAALSVVLFRFQGLESIHLNHGRMMVEWLERDLSTAIRNSLRSYDRLGKLEQGEYCLVAPDVGSAHLPLLMERLIQHVQAWNLSVTSHSHIRIPILLGMRGVTIFPDYQPHHLEAAVKIFWDWICLEHSSEALGDALIFEVRLTEKGIERVPDSEKKVFSGGIFGAATTDKQ